MANKKPVVTVPVSNRDEKPETVKAPNWNYKNGTVFDIRGLKGYLIKESLKPGDYVLVTESKIYSITDKGWIRVRDSETISNILKGE